jgi:lipoprotein signal peptidase
LIFINRDQVVRRWQQGVVRDFIKMEPRIPLGGGRHLEVWPWVYNIADVLLVVGVAILLFNFWRERRAAHALQRQQEAAAGTGKAAS